MKSFIKFANRNDVPTKLVDYTVQHYEYVWKRTKGYSSSTILKSFHPVLEADFCNHIYVPTLTLVDFFTGISLTDLTHLATNFVEEHFTKGAYIMRCNDVQRSLFIVHRGKVDIIVAKQRLCVLRTGGVFGCLSSKGVTRQTITAKARIHADVLVIDSAKFGNVVSKYSIIKHKFKRASTANCEYILATAARHTHSGNESKISKEQPLFYHRFLIYPQRKWYKIFLYTLDVHISTVSTVLIMPLIVQVGEFNINNFYHMMYVFDAIFLVKIAMGFVVVYVDTESGILVTSLVKISKKYLASNFWFDIFTCVPLEILHFNYLMDFYNILWANRILKIYFMIRYYYVCKNKLTVSKHLQWTYLVYLMAFVIHSMVCIW